MSSRIRGEVARSSQEQLRLDHIETLEILQKCKDENKQLKRELNGLKAGTCAEALNDKGCIESSGDKDNGLNLLELVEQITKQDEEIKLLKAKVNSSERELMKQRQSQSNAQKASVQSFIDNNKRKQIEMTDAVLELEEKLRAARQQLADAFAYQSRSEELTEINADLMGQIEELKNINNELLLAREEMGRESQSIKLDMQRFQDETQRKADIDRKYFEQLIVEQNEQFEKSLQEYADQNSKLRNDLAINAECTYKAQELARDLEDQCSGFKDKVHMLASQLQAAQEQLQLVASSHSDNEPPGTTFLLTASAATVDKTKAMRLPVGDDINNDNILVEEEFDGSSSSFRFQEFLRLKRENKELKLRLVEASSSSLPHLSARTSNDDINSCGVIPVAVSSTRTSSAAATFPVAMGLGGVTNAARNNTTSSSNNYCSNSNNTMEGKGRSGSSSRMKSSSSSKNSSSGSSKKR